MSGQRILVVDDSPFTGEAVAWALRGAGFVVEVARDLWDLERPDLTQPDLVLMDVVLQEAFGDDLAMLLRGVRGFECPIVLLSSLPDHLLERRAADADLNGYISKRSGLQGIVSRARELLGVKAEDSEAAAASSDRFEVIARQRVRRILHVYANEAKWNTTAIGGEAHALAGDADLAGATKVAEAARAVRDIAQRLGGAGASSEIVKAVQTLAAEVPGARRHEGIVLLVGASMFTQERLLAALDAAGMAVVEAHSLVELRPKLHAAVFDLVVVESELIEAEPPMLHEIRSAMDATILTLRDQQANGPNELARSAGAMKVVDEIARRIKRS
jgi:CheY-like chemotaxis protein